MKKRIMSVLLAAVLVMSLCACGAVSTESTLDSNASKDAGEATEEAAGGDAVDEAAGGSSSEDITIGLSLWGFDNQYFVNVRDGAQKRADEIGAELVVADPNQDVSQQVSDVENFITMGVDAIILSAINANDFQGDVGTLRMVGIIKSFCQLGGCIATITTCDIEELEDAKIHPEAHRNLMVRMGGLSAYFIAMSPAQQENIIQRFSKGVVMK